MKTLTLVSVALAGFLFTPQISASEEGRGFWKPRMRFLKTLDLTPTQKEELQKLREVQRPKIRAIRKQMRQARQQMQTAMKNAKSTEAELREAFDSVTKLRTEMARHRFEKLLAMRKILKPEQFEKLSFATKKKMRKMRKRMRKLREEHGFQD